MDYSSSPSCGGGLILSCSLSSSAGKSPIGLIAGRNALANLMASATPNSSSLKCICECTSEARVKEGHLAHVLTKGASV